MRKIGRKHSRQSPIRRFQGKKSRGACKSQNLQTITRLLNTELVNSTRFSESSSESVGTSRQSSVLTPSFSGKPVHIEKQILRERGRRQQFEHLNYNSH